MFVYDTLIKVSFIIQNLLSDGIAYDFGMNNDAFESREV